MRVWLGYMSACWVGGSVAPLYYWWSGQMPGLVGPLVTFIAAMVMLAFADWRQLKPE